MLKKASSYHRVMILLIMIIIVFNMLACSKSFCDVYTEYIYGVAADVGAKITSSISLAVGEILMYTGIIFVIVSMLLLILLILFRKRNGYVIFLIKHRYTYPYTMEITGNKYTDKLYYPSLYAHESAHHQGYYRENEANLFEYLACINSDDKVIKYSGFISMYYYVDDAYLIMLGETDDDSLWNEYNSVQVSDIV